MKIHWTAFLIIAAALTVSTGSTAGAASLPGVKTAAGNAVPECATPGRLTAFLAARNANLDERFSRVATAYMQYGEDLGVRWDYAFFQMMLETGNLSYKRGNGKAGNVKPTQNNFAGLGATGNGEQGEIFKDIDAGVKAHLQHLLMYAGDRVIDPVAERTRKVQEWGILTAWQKGFKKPITFEDLAKQWAPGSNAYSRDIETVGSHFYDDFCNKADPKPNLVQEARAGRRTTSTVAMQSVDKPIADKPNGAELARSALERGRNDGDAGRAALGATRPIGSVTIINETPQTEQAAPQIQTASAATAAKPQGAGAAAVAGPSGATLPAAKCRVWTASYGGQKSVIIRSVTDKTTNYTVLDVNDGQEARETDAYIAAYAKGGQKVGDFQNAASAMEKAFQLCPEG